MHRIGRTSRGLLAASALVVTLTALAPPAAADAVRVAGTSVSMEPPAGYAPAARYPGFEHPEQGGSIMVAEIPGPFAEVRKGMTKEGLASRGMTLLESSEVSLGEHRGLLLEVGQSAGGREFRKWMVVAGDDGATVLVVGTFPADAARTVGTALRRAVLSARWPATQRLDPYEGLLFRVEPTARLRLAGRMGNNLMLSESGGTGPLPPDELFLVVGGSISETSIGDPRTFAEKRAALTQQVTELRIVSGAPVEVDGLPGWELEADATDVGSGLAVRLYQLILADGRSYFIAQGIAPRDRAAEATAELRRVTHTFRRVR